MNSRLTVILICLLTLAVSGYFIFPSLFQEIIFLFSNGIYAPHFNASGIVCFNDKSIHCYVYSLIIVVTIIVYVVEWIVGKNRNFKNTASPAVLIQVAFVMFFIILTIDFIGQEKLFKYHKITYKGKTTAERLSMIFGNSYDFARFVKGRVHGRWGGVLVTDYNLLGTLEPYVVIYQLYPAVDLAVNPLRAPDVLVVFNKKHPENFLSQRYPWSISYDEFSLLAVNDRFISSSINSTFVREK